MAWLDDAQPFLKRRINIVSRQNQAFFFSIDGITPIIEGSIRSANLAIYVMYGSACWDILIDADCYPKKMRDGYVCSICNHERKLLFATREALWRDHLFKPLMKWINEELSVAKCLLLHESKGGGATWATLSYSVPSYHEATAAIPISLGVSL